MKNSVLKNNKTKRKKKKVKFKGTVCYRLRKVNKFGSVDIPIYHT